MICMVNQGGSYQAQTIVFSNKCSIKPTTSEITKYSPNLLSQPVCQLNADLISNAAHFTSNATV